MELIDIGVNLEHRSFERDREEVIKRAEAVGVKTMILTGTTLRASQEVLNLARQYNLYATAGVHPHNALHCDDGTIPTLKRLASKPEVVAIGECGLDYNRDFSPRQVQDRWFEAQVKLACDLKMPLFLHERDAHSRLAEILRHYLPNLNRAVVHCFTGTRAELEIYLELDFYIGITGWICDERRGRHLQELVKYIPLNRLMLETDAPFLTPRNIAPKPKDGRNEPAYLTYVLDKVAENMKKSREEVAAATTQTAKEFFGI
jgi:TatD DNase family protein